MRILYINTTDVQGGAAVVMQRLRKSLARNYAVEDRLLVKTRSSDDDGTRQLLSSAPLVYAEKAIDKITKTAGLLYQFFPFTSGRILEEARDFKPDIIHLHNTHGSYFPTTLIRPLSRIAPIIWTLHDMWSFTGNSAHTFGNMSWKYMKNDPALTNIPPTIWLNAGAWLLRQKKRIYGQSDITVVCPSAWLQELAMQSPVFAGKEIVRIYNGVDTDVFSPGDKQLARRKLGLPEDTKTVMFSAQFLGRRNPWKGGADLEDILKLLDDRTTEKINFLAIGQGRMTPATPFRHLQVVYRDYVSGEPNMADCFRASDLFIYPTRADNLPNALVESIACGIPAVTFDVGGISEIITNDHNGAVLPPFDLKAFAGQTLELLADNEKRALFSQNCREKACRLFTAQEMADHYYHLYQKIITRRSLTN